MDEHESKLKSKDSRTPVSIVVPITYAVRETLLTYLAAAFLNNPIFRYSGAGPEDTIGAMLLERVVDLQCRRSKVALDLYVLWSDALTYGFGAAVPAWYVKRGVRTRAVKSYTYDNLNQHMYSMTPTESSNRVRYETVIFEGNRLDVIDPYMALPDPNVPIHKASSGEYFGWVDRTNQFDILREEIDNPKWFNGKYLKHIDGRSVLYDTDPSERNKFKLPRVYDDTLRPVDILYMYVDLIPSEWKLTRSEYPEKWLFGLAGDGVIVHMTRWDTDFDLFPVVTMAPDFDGHSIAPLSRLEVVAGLQEFANFKINSQIANVRRAINNVLLVDPMLVNMNDVLNPNAEGVIRLRPSVWGRGIENAVTQLKVTDVTQNNLPDALALMELVNRVSGAVDSLQGVRRSGSERVTATEAAGDRTGALSRLERMARICSIMGMQDIAQIFALNTQQFADLPQYVKASTGREAEILRMAYGGEDSIYTEPDDLLVDYDVVVGDGSSPTTGDVNSQITLFQIAATDPEIRQEVDIVKMFFQISQMSGNRNVQDILRTSYKAKAQPQSQIDSGVESGNLVPIGDMVNG